MTEIAADFWFSDWRKGGELLEEARHLSRFDQTLTLGFDESDEPPGGETYENDEDDSGLLND